MADIVLLDGSFAVLRLRKEVGTNKRPTVLAAALFVLLLIILSVPPLGYYFGVLVEPFSITASIMRVVAVWFFLVRAIWQANLFERFLVWKTAHDTGSRYTA